MTPGDLVLTKIGKDNEPKGRDWYELNFGVKVNEVGLAVPKWDNRIGASSDGEVEGTQGIIEIKSPLNLYRSLKTEEVVETRIMASHYDQMQGTMAIMNKEWCDYVVYPHLDDEVYVERVYFDSPYWEELYRELTPFLDTNKDLFVEKLPYKLN